MLRARLRNESAPIACAMSKSTMRQQKQRASIAKGDRATADLLFIQVIALVQHIFGADKQAALEAATGMADVLRRRGLDEEASGLETHARMILG